MKILYIDSVVYVCFLELLYIYIHGDLYAIIGCWYIFFIHKKNMIVKATMKGSGQ